MHGVGGGEGSGNGSVDGNERPGKGLALTMQIRGIRVRREVLCQSGFSDWSMERAMEWVRGQVLALPSGSCDCGASGESGDHGVSASPSSYFLPAAPAIPVRVRKSEDASDPYSIPLASKSHKHLLRSSSTLPSHLRASRGAERHVDPNSSCDGRSAPADSRSLATQPPLSH
jgi:hypothetical protein